jgi:hypothetical protein
MLKGGEFYQHANVDCSDLLDFAFKPTIKALPFDVQTVLKYWKRKGQL